MITTSALYNSIFAGQHSVEWKITINGTDYGMDKISASLGGGSALPHLHRQLFSDSTPATGACVSSTFECSIFEASANVPRMATVVPAYRIKNDTQTSEWITLGTFYIDTRSVNKSTGALSLTCYDRMLVADGADGKNYADVTAFTTWPQSMGDVVTEIATIMGITVDARTSINTGTGYMVNYPNDYTMREVLGYIAVAHAGCWTITPDNKLRLIPITGGTDTINLGTNTKKLSSAIPFSAWSGVTVYYGDETAYQSGDDTGRVMTCDCPWATQDTADGILSVIDGVAYQPFSTGVAYINLAAELGDIVTVGLPGETVTAPLFTLDIVAETIEAATVSAEGEEEIDHEYPYRDYVDRSLQRKVTLGQSYYGTSISRDKGIEIARSDGNSRAIFNSDLFAMQAKIDGVMQNRIWFDPVKGDYVFEGSLGADAVFTESLYAEQGDIAELTVDSLSTSRRVRKYILGDQSDDNYIKIQDQYMRFITGTVTSTTPVQATNRNGSLLYWQREPVSHDANGYPLDSDGQQIYATLTATSWPVYTYTYSELIKGELYFALENGVYVPMLVMGAGDNHGYTKGTLHKSPTGLDVLFTTTAGETIGLKALSAGWLDLYGLRKPTNLDFSDWDNGTFEETLDGNVVETFSVDFDANDRPIKITDSDGHETAIAWEATP